MKFFSALLTLFCLLGFAHTANAIEGFGNFFTDEAPTALEGISEGTPQDVLSEILAIEPAAGDADDADDEGDNEDESENDEDSDEPGDDDEEEGDDED